MRTNTIIGVVVIVALLIVASAAALLITNANGSNGNGTDNERSSITITSPTSSITWYRGGEHTITWTSQSDVGDYVKIEGGFSSSQIYTIAAQTENDGTYRVAIDHDPSPYGSSEFIRITSVSNPTISVTSSYFSIADAISVTSPSPNSQFVKGEQYTIRWSSASVVGSTVMIEIGVKGAMASTMVICESTQNTGSYQWTVPSTLASREDYSIRVSSIAEPGLYAGSGYFTILPGPDEMCEYNYALVTADRISDGNSWVSPSDANNHYVIATIWLTNNAPGAVTTDCAKWTLTNGSIVYAASSKTDYSTVNHEKTDVTNGYSALFTIVYEVPEDVDGGTISYVGANKNYVKFDAALPRNNPIESVGTPQYLSPTGNAYVLPGFNTLSWYQEENATFYEIEVKESWGGPWSEADVFLTTNTHLQISSLANEVHWRIRAWTSWGETASAWSDWNTFTHLPH